jgi:hypothetical protein
MQRRTVFPLVLAVSALGWRQAKASGQTVTIHGHLDFEEKIDLPKNCFLGVSLEYPALEHGVVLGGDRAPIADTKHRWRFSFDATLPGYDKLPLDLMVFASVWMNNAPLMSGSKRITLNEPSAVVSIVLVPRAINPASLKY